jgi:D-lactate dehydrogenase (cytochrome)
MRALRPGTAGIATDVCVPISRLAECVEAAREKAAELGLIAPILGHVGDGNFHVTPLIDLANPKEVAAAETYVGWLAEVAIAMDGTCTGEHGIGQGKRAYLRKELGEAVDVMAAIKTALDPLGIMNPGKVL